MSDAAELLPGDSHVPNYQLPRGSLGYRHTDRAPATWDCGVFLGPPKSLLSREVRQALSGHKLVVGTISVLDRGVSVVQALSIGTSGVPGHLHKLW